MTRTQCLVHPSVLTIVHATVLVALVSSVSSPRAAAQGGVVAWGDNQFGQCDVPAAPPGVTYVQLSAGIWHSAARLSDGSIVAWGVNNSGECNVLTLPPGLTYVQVSAGDSFVAARRSDGSLVAWGSNSQGQSSVPVLVPGLTYVDVAADGAHTIALVSNGRALGWGFNAYGECNVPQLPAGLAYVEVATKGNNSAARRSNGSVLAWGSNVFGQNDVPWTPPGIRFVEISAGETHNVARLSDGSIRAWGWNAHGQTDVPALPPGLIYVEVVAGGLHNLARTAAPCSTPIITYCTAETNSLGRVPAIAMSGQAGMGFNSGCTLTVANLISNAPGVFFYGTVGPQETPFHGGFLCIAPPLRRGPILNTGGSGVLSEDFGVYIQSGADPALTAGATVWIQCLSRDSGDAYGDSLSDAVSTTICP